MNHLLFMAFNFIVLGHMRCTINIVAHNLGKDALAMKGGVVQDDEFLTFILDDVIKDLQ